jgi:chemotaxis protein methyltransferase CheR
MENVGYRQVYGMELTDAQFNKLSDFIYGNYGIKMPIVKKVMLQSRLHKRLKALGMNSFDQYISFVFSDVAHTEEVVNMIDAVSTNKTDFFREAAHFDYLADTVFPALSKEGSRKANIWSAGCSSGEEPYTLAIVAQKFKEANPGFDYSIKATDISTRVLNMAAQGTYDESRTDVIPLDIKKKYFLRSKDRTDPKVKIVKTLRDKVSFYRLNFMDRSYAMHDTFDIIFCRNVLIYFDKQTQEEVINKLCSKLRKGGYFFLGHSESTAGLAVPLKQLRPTIFTHS